MVQYYPIIYHKDDPIRNFLPKKAVLAGCIADRKQN